ncbi:hypothetical protein B0I35DRAFT_16221 [Stachybotrys elegans]|uniref:Uncharacterized protein n=1 Tax=Stachybotrys elegans TaxID=80388 RepID=A0A8K0T6N4_9HYPO|nr:hypothetical protein B0I35DRAFT_16221 [Stachybotrys elegans]
MWAQTELSFPEPTPPEHQKWPKWRWDASHTDGFKDQRMARPPASSRALFACVYLLLRAGVDDRIFLDTVPPPRLGTPPSPSSSVRASMLIGPVPFARVPYPETGEGRFFSSSSSFLLATYYGRPAAVHVWQAVCRMAGLAPARHVSKRWELGRNRQRHMLLRRIGWDRARLSLCSAEYCNRSNWAPRRPAPSCGLLLRVPWMRARRRICDVAPAIGCLVYADLVHGSSRSSVISIGIILAGSR